MIRSAKKQVQIVLHLWFVVAAVVYTNVKIRFVFGKVSRVNLHLWECTAARLYGSMRLVADW